MMGVKSFFFTVMIPLLASDYTTAGTWSTIDIPGPYNTMAYGISNNNIVGYYYENLSSNKHGFFYDGTSWTTLNYPGAINTYIYGIDGSNIIGYRDFPDIGFLYNGITWKILKPGETQIYPYGIDGDNIVGNIRSHGFLYDGSNWITLDMPDAKSTYARDIDGSNIIGYYHDINARTRGFLYNGSEWITLDMPDAFKTFPYGIDGANIVGYYVDFNLNSHGFLYNGSKWITLDMPGADDTLAFDIEGSKIVGCYHVPGFYHGFIYEIPEPATLLILTLACPFLLRGRPAFEKAGKIPFDKTR